MFGVEGWQSDIALTEGWWRAGNQSCVIEPLSSFAMIDRPASTVMITDSSVGLVSLYAGWM